MNKLSLLVLLFSLTTAQVSAQEKKNIIGLSAGKTFFGSGDIWGANATATYERKLWKRLWLQARVSLAQGNNFIESNVPDNPYPIFYNANHSQKFNLGLLINLFEIRMHSLGLSVNGVSLKTAKFRSGSYFRNPDPNAPKEFQYFFTRPTYRKDVTMGGSLGIGYKYKIKNNLLAGFQVDYQQFIRGDVEENINLGLYYAF
jgi:hypothetical protein